MSLTITPLEGFPEVASGMDLAELVAQSHVVEDGDVVVLAHKVVSKAEGRVVRLDEIEPSDRARELAGSAADARQVEVVLGESRLRVRGRRRVERAGGGNARPAAARSRWLRP